MAKYWSTKKPRSVIEGRRATLKLLLEYANVDLAQEKQTVFRLKEKILDYLSRHPVLHPDNLGWRPLEVGAGMVVEILQEHLRCRLQFIIDRKKWPTIKETLWPIPGSRTFIFYPLEKRFYMQSQLEKVTPCVEVQNAEELNLQLILLLWSQVIDVSLAEIISDLDSNPWRFGRCKLCQTYFYCPTDQERTYCSNRCGNAVRQKNFLAKRRDEKK